MEKISQPESTATLLVQSICPPGSRVADIFPALLALIIALDSSGVLPEKLKFEGFLTKTCNAPGEREVPFVYFG